MPNILLATDLHLSASDREYSLGVLREIVKNASDKDALFLLGDTFNTFDDIEALRQDFSEIVESIKTDIFLLKGNHEDLWSYGSNLSNFKFANNVHIIAKEPFEVVKIGSVFVFAMPYQNKNINIDGFDINDYDGPKIFLAHGIVEGLLWQLEDKEAMSVVPKSVIKYINPNLAILGHIHKRIEYEIDNIPVIYPGASRVWRHSKAEVGKKYCLSLSINGKIIDREFIEIVSAGEYKTYELNIKENLHEDIEKIVSSAFKYDTIDILLNGIIEDENSVYKVIEDVKLKNAKYVRDISIKLNRVVMLSENKNEAIISDFLNVVDEYLKNTLNKKEREYINIARDIGLEKIATALKTKQGK